METENDQGRDGQLDIRESELEAQVASLEARLADREAALHHQRIVAEEATRKISALFDDLTTLADELREEAMRRDWCSEYGRFVDEVNGRTSQPWLRHCTWTYELRYEVRIVVEARSIDDLADEVRSALGDAVEAVEWDDASFEEVDVHQLSRERTS